MRSQNQKALIGLTAGIVVIAAMQRYTDRQALMLGLPPAIVALAIIAAGRLV